MSRFATLTQRDVRPTQQHKHLAKLCRKPMSQDIRPDLLARLQAENQMTLICNYCPIDLLIVL